MKKFILAFVAIIFVAANSVAINNAQAAVRFVVLGDAGEGNLAQYQVGVSMDNICNAKGCDFALYLGDNFYDNGVDSVNDAQFSTKFELPYNQLDFPFYVVLGTHDYGGSSLEFWKPWYQVSYTIVNPTSKWQLPWMYYSKEKENVAFFMIDSTSVFNNLNFNDQRNWLTQQLVDSTAEWKIVLGHHPYISNGRHGNAGNYEGCSFSFCSRFNGKKLKEFMDTAICGKADYYFSGHDRNLQWLQPKCGTGFIVSGAGAKTTELVHRDNNPVYWENDTTEGFMWVEIDGQTFTGTFYDLNGNELFTRVETK